MNGVVALHCTTRSGPGLDLGAAAAARAARRIGASFKECILLNLGCYNYFWGGLQFLAGVVNERTPQPRCKGSRYYSTFQSSSDGDKINHLRCSVCGLHPHLTVTSGRNICTLIRITLPPP